MKQHRFFFRLVLLLFLFSQPLTLAASNQDPLTKEQIVAELKFWIHHKDFPGVVVQKECVKNSKSTIWSEVQTNAFCSLPRELQGCLHKNLLAFKSDGTNRSFLRAFKKCETQEGQYQGVYYQKPFANIPSLQKRNLKRILITEPIPNYADQKWILNNLFGRERPYFAQAEVQSSSTPPKPNPFVPPSASVRKWTVNSMLNQPASDKAFPQLCQVIGSWVHIRSEPNIQSESIGFISKSPILVTQQAQSQRGVPYSWYPIQLPTDQNPLDGFIAKHLINCRG